MRKVIAKDRGHLEALIEKAIDAHGDACDLNHIDVSKVEDFDDLFRECFPNFLGDISRWNVSNATSMASMFCSTNFKGDISNWNVGKVTDMSSMFENSQFDGDLSRWDVSQVLDMERMFDNAQFTSDLSKWNVSKVQSMSSMFTSTLFNRDISKWNVSNVKYMWLMFNGSHFQGDISLWDTSNVEDMRQMFQDAIFQKNLSGWNTRRVLYLRDMFAGNLQGLSVQQISAWTIRLFLEHNVLPQEPYWKDLFQEILPLAKMLQLDVVAQAGLIWTKNTGIAKQEAVGLPLPKLNE